MRFLATIKYLLISCLLLAGFVNAFGHPHVFMESSVTFLCGNTGLEGVEIRWTFDEMFSSMIIGDYDANRNGAFEAKEIKAVEDGAFSNLSNFNYFLYIKLDKKNYPIKAIKNFKAEIVKHRLIYIFTVPLPIPVTEVYKELTLGVFDSDYYCDIVFRKKDPVQIKENPAVKYDYVLSDDKDNAYWSGQIIPKIIRLKLKKNDA